MSRKFRFKNWDIDAFHLIFNFFFKEKLFSAQKYENSKKGKKLYLLVEISRQLFDTDVSNKNIFSVVDAVTTFVEICFSFSPVEKNVSALAFFFG